MYDPDYDYEEEREDARKKKKGAQSDAAPAPEPVIYEDLVEQFIDEYEPVSFEQDAEIHMDMGMLREYFGAYPQFGFPDSMPTYIEMLRRYGFRLRTNFEHQPVYFLKRKEIPLAEEYE